MKKYLLFIQRLGFSDVKQVRKLPNIVQFSFTAFDPKVTRETLGSARKHVDGVFIFRLSADKVVRVNTKRRFVWLGNGKDMVKKFLNSI